MSRAHINRLLCAMALMIGMFMTGNGTAAAQNCCSFTADVKFVPASCFKLGMTTSWGGVITRHSLGANGIYPNLPFLSASTCPPAPPFDWVSLDGGVTRVALGETRVVPAGNNCCVTVTVAQDAIGCIYITINGFTSTPC